MAGAICHELGQPLQLISGTIQLLLMDMPENDRAYGKIFQMKQQADRIAKITKKLAGITSL